MLDGERLYGRGGADDGYAVFAATLALKACQNLGLPHPRLVFLIEGAEESSSANFMYYVQQLDARIGKPDLIICSDSGAGNYETFWYTTSLRGNIKA